MGAFEYVALDSNGRESKGLIEGDTAKHVRQQLRERSLLPVKVNEVAEKQSGDKASFSLRRGISSGDLALLTRQLATLTASGLPLEEALLAVSEQNENPRAKSIMLGVRSKVMEGHTLADGLRRSIAPRSRPASNPATWMRCWSDSLNSPSRVRHCSSRYAMR